ncbi:hypothetical protein K2Y11_15025 [bacterium]|nr:hypothetical protein [bacterium]
MGHDAKVSLKHYAQTTDEHFERAVGDANSDAKATQIPTQQVAAPKSGISKEIDAKPVGIGYNAILSDAVRKAAMNGCGEGGIRTPGPISGTQHFQ